MAYFEVTMLVKTKPEIEKSADGVRKFKNKLWELLRHPKSPVSGVLETTVKTYSKEKFEKKRRGEDVEPDGVG